MSITKNSRPGLLYDTKASNSDAIALYDLQAGTAKDQQEITYQNLYKYIDCCQSFLINKGIKKGSKVILKSRNSVSIVAMIMALWRQSAVAIPVDFRMTAPEMANIAQKIEADLVLASSNESYEEIEENLGDSKHLLCRLESCLETEINPDLSGEESNEDFDGLVILTSGTTGMPKGAVHSYHSLIDNLLELADLVNLNENKKILLPLPVSHIFGLEVLLISILNRAQMVFCDLDPLSFATAINKFDPNIVAGVPTIYGALLSLGKEKVKLNSAEVLLSGGAPLPVPMAKQFEQEFSKRLNNGYGSTESKIICLNIEGPLESVGRPIPSCRINILDENGNQLREGEVGEIFIDSNLLMKEYLNLPQKTEEVLTKTGYKTGDIGYLSDNYLFISGRAKEMIIVAGNKVFPIEVEQVMAKCPMVKEVAITGEDHSRLGQIVKATIVIDDAKLSESIASADTELAKSARAEILAQLKDFAKANLKRELRPMVWNLRPTNTPLPKTASGKIDKKAL